MKTNMKTLENTRPKREKYLFTFRYEKSLHNRILQCCKRTGLSYKDVIQQAFALFAIHYKKGEITMETVSDFLLRDDKDDKITVQSEFHHTLKTMLKRYAFAFGFSQAEILRMALEYYIKGIYYSLENYKEKNHHDDKRPWLISLFMDLYSINYKPIYYEGERVSTVFL